jgi:Protein of unknown function (DUF2911)
MNRKWIPAVLALAATSFCLAGSGTQPSGKTPAETEATFAGKTVAIKYNKVSANGRTVFGGSDALLKENTVWRPGTGNPTTLYTSAELNLGGLVVPPGAYTLYIQLDPKGWQLIVSKAKGAAANVYRQSQDLGRATMTMGKTPSHIENLKFSVVRGGGNGGNLKLEWANVAASVPFTVK